MKDFLLKIRRYDGSESVLDDFDTFEDAQTAADEMNAQEQSHNYYVERFERSKLDWPDLPTARAIFRKIHGIEGGPA